jgi:hypothetical protein
MIGWPHSLADWDLIFAAPLPWVGPVGAALAVGATMVLSSGYYLHSEAGGQPLKAGLPGWVALGSGSLTLMGAFWWDIRNVLGSGYPQPVNWTLLTVGLGLILLGMFVGSLKRTKSHAEPVAGATRGR